MKEKQTESSNVIIREMLYSDIKEVYSIEKNTFSDAWSYESFEYSVNAGHDYAVVAEYDGRICGYGIIRIGYDVIDITNIAVADYMRRNKIAEHIMETLIGCGADAGIHQYMLEVRISNIPAGKLYHKLGFETVGIRKNYYSDPVEDALVMSLRI